MPLIAETVQAVSGDGLPWPLSRVRRRGMLYAGDASGVKRRILAACPVDPAIAAK